MDLSEPRRFILVANPGSASRKYALYDQNLTVHAELHFEYEHDGLIGTLHADKERREVDFDVNDLTEAARHVVAIFRQHHILNDDDSIDRIGLRIVAPSSFFTHDREFTDEIVKKLQEVQDLAPIHITATLRELELLRESYPNTPIIGVSDSAFHLTKPNYAWNYGIQLQDADRFDIKRFGYHGISVSAAINTLWSNGKLPPKVIVCHLGSGSSITAVFHGRSVDTTMGFTPLEGLVMATRSGSIDFGAIRALKKNLSMDDDQLEDYLHHKSGLLGLGGSNDIRELIEREKNGDHHANLALTTLVHSIHKAIGQMMVILNGTDMLVFTGTVGERSAVLRKRIVAHLEFADFILDGDANDACTNPDRITRISQSAASKPLIVIPTNEGYEIAKHTQKTIVNNNTSHSTVTQVW